GSLESPLSVSGIAAPGSETRFQVSLNTVAGTRTQIARIPTFSGTLDDINNSLLLGWISNRGIANSLSAKVEEAQKTTQTGRNNVLNAFKNEVTAQAGKHITNIAAQVLLQDADGLIAQSH